MRKYIQTLFFSETKEIRVDYILKAWAGPEELSLFSLRFFFYL